MIIGIDFDNTLVCYDQVFRKYHEKQNWDIAINADSPKRFIRNKLLESDGGNLQWSTLQGEVYGKRILDAQLYEGARNFLQHLSKLDVTLKIISHKSLFPVVGTPIKFHDSALSFLEKENIFNDSLINIDRSNCFFESTIENKINRIYQENCDIFIDDLLEVLTHPLFPNDTIPLLFSNVPSENSSIKTFSNWQNLEDFSSNEDLITSHPNRFQERSPTPVYEKKNIDPIPSFNHILEKENQSPVKSLEPLSGGANNKVFKLTTVDNKELCGKIYKRIRGDKRNRFLNEINFIRYLYPLNLKIIPKLIGANETDGVAIFNYINGHLHDRDQSIPSRYWQECISFIETIQASEKLKGNIHLQSGSEAMFSIKNHMTALHARRDKWLNLAKNNLIDKALSQLITEKVEPAYQTVARIILPLEGFNKTIGKEEQIISPSDLGLHNALICKDSKDITFIDFEYAGWDDPAKTLSDFYCQPTYPAPIKYVNKFYSSLQKLIPENFRKDFNERLPYIFEIIRLKWCLIVLNPFLNNDQPSSKAIELAKNEIDRLLSLPQPINS